MKYNIRLLFTCDDAWDDAWDDACDDACDDVDEMESYTIIVPDQVTLSDVEDKLYENHKFLCENDEEDRYGIEGRNPNTLLRYTCEKEGWTYNELSYDLDLNF